MTIKELAAKIGRRGMLLDPTGMRIPVVVIDARQAYARIDLCVTPVGGDGHAWVSAERVNLGPETK